jgi:hypothetical protein
MERAVQGAFDGNFFGGEAEGGVPGGGEVQTAEEGLEIAAGGANDVGESAVRGVNHLAVHGSLLDCSAWRGKLLRWKQARSSLAVE